MKHSRTSRLFMTALAVAVLGAGPYAQTAEPTIDEELSRLRKELVQAQVDCQRVIQEIEKDKKDFEAYRVRTNQRLTQARIQLDTMKSEINVHARANAALGAQIAGVQAKVREIELAQEEFRQRLIGICKGIQPAVKGLPPISMTPTLSALSLLSNDLSSRTVDIVEGCTRIVQILNRLEETCGGIQIAQESSPAPEIRGTVYRLRIGSFFEAVVDLKGEKCALFEGWSEDGAPRWKSQESPAMAQALLQAVNIREGKSLPAFVNLPLAPAAGQGGDL